MPAASSRPPAPSCWPPRGSAIAPYSGTKGCRSASPESWRRPRPEPRARPRPAPERVLWGCGPAVAGRFLANCPRSPARMERLMNPFDSRSATRPEPDQAMVDIANYVTDYYIGSSEAYTTARSMLLDSLACAMLAMRHPECVKHLGPLVPGAYLPGGARVPGTSPELDPVQAAYNIGVQIRWLDFNDTWLAAEWGHPSDNLGAILAVGDWLSRKAEREQRKMITVRDILTWAIKAHEIQGCYALKNAFNRVGLDHVILVRLASSAITTHMLGG